uniref:Uncharacterized protein n=1 Tax=viral metagenome TaxID=1070528 RepID=A0A6M3JAA1_9ZZZZ
MKQAQHTPEPLKRSDVTRINAYLRARYDGCRNIRHDGDGAVTCTVDRMPNTNTPGRIFAGWARDLLWEAIQEAK